MADQEPNISQGVPVPAYNKPMGGPHSNQRATQQARQRAFYKKKQDAANGPSPCVPHSGPPPGDS